MVKSELTTYEGVSMALVVKRIKGKLYVYEEYRIGRKVITKYIGPLEEIVRLYQISRLQSQVNYKLGRRELRRLSKAIAREVVNSIRNSKSTNVASWWARGDLNPGPPPCEGGVLTRLDDGPVKNSYILVIGRGF